MQLRIGICWNIPELTLAKLYIYFIGLRSFHSNHYFVRAFKQLPFRDHPLVHLVFLNRTKFSSGNMASKSFFQTFFDIINSFQTEKFSLRYFWPVHNTLVTLCSTTHETSYFVRFTTLLAQPWWLSGLRRQQCSNMVPKVTDSNHPLGNFTNLSSQIKHLNS